MGNGCVSFFYWLLGLLSHETGFEVGIVDSEIPRWTLCFFLEMASFILSDRKEGTSSWCRRWSKRVALWMALLISA